MSYFRRTTCLQHCSLLFRSKRNISFPLSEIIAKNKKVSNYKLLEKEYNVTILIAETISDVIDISIDFILSLKAIYFLLTVL